MLFSSISFIYYFLPILLIIYYIFPNDKRNIVLLIASLIFYFYGENLGIWVLLLSCTANYLFGVAIDRFNFKKTILVISLIFNLGLLIFFKYTDFFIDNINHIFKSEIPLLNIALPLGISFFTFQTMSYVIDVYRSSIKANYNPIDFFTYVSLFPQLVAGPIVRYKDVNDELKSREHTIKKFSSGISRFIIGLSKKVLLANALGEVSKQILGLNEGTILGFWCVAVADTLQIYLDFSGYSDMAIGLGRMFGFEFLENFNYPLIAKSIKDFWRRWHITLSSFFKDYVYIPLGGNRVSTLKWIRNILVVWALTGFWHGALWNFILWGLYFAVLLILENKVLGSFLEKHKIIAHIYTPVLIIISFVIFNTTSFSDIIFRLKSMFGLSGIDIINAECLFYIRDYFVIILIAIVASTPLLKNIKNKLLNNSNSNKIIGILEPICYVVLLLLVTAFLVDSSFNPFLYFRF